MKVSPVLLLVACLCPWTFIPLVKGQNTSYAKALITQLFDTNGYNKKIRPEQDQGTITSIYVSLFLKSIIELDEVSEKLVTTGALFLQWVDTNLVWDSTQYDGLTTLFVPQDDVWKPDVILLNSVKDYTALGASSIQMVVFNDGSITWHPIQKFESACSINIKYFPYDEQTCSLKFGAWSYTKNEVSCQTGYVRMCTVMLKGKAMTLEIQWQNYESYLPPETNILMVGGTSGIDLHDYSDNPVWEVLDSRWEVEWDSGEASISFNLKLRRKPLFVVFSTIVPIILLSILNTFVFILPNESGERSGYAITVFLALAVFLTIIFSTLPANSETVAWFSIYITAMTVQSTLITLITHVLIRIGNIDDPKLIPGFLVKLVNLSKRMRCRKARVGDVDNKNTPIHIADLEDGKIEKSEKAPKLNPNDRRHTFNDTSGENEGEVTWKEAMTMIDILCLVFFSLTAFILSMVCLLMAKGNK